MSLIPYIYSMAHKANRTGMPIARALSLVYPDVPEYDYVTNTYMLGDSLLVAVFDMNVTLPEGTWFDYFTGERYEGGRTVKYEIPEKKGGALFVRAGGILALGHAAECVERIPTDHYDLAVYPGEDGTFTLVEDDGYTFDYENGGTADTVISITDTSDGGFTLTVGERKGTFAGREKREGDRYKESDPEIKGAGEPCAFTVRVKNTAVSSITVNGKNADVRREGGDSVFDVSKELRSSDVVCKIVY
jgi:alpha-glucosidase (family GH31 glycosyl hydrolase)